MKIIQDIKTVLDIFKSNIQVSFKPIRFQIVGIAAIVTAYVFFGLERPYIAWFAVLLPFCGIPELILIWVWKKTITKFGRSLFEKRVDVIIMFGAIPLTWWLFGPTASGMLFIGLLLNHICEKQTKETIY